MLYRWRNSLAIFSNDCSRSSTLKGKNALPPVSAVRYFNTLSPSLSTLLMLVPVSASVYQYQTTLIALLNGGTSVFQETLFAPFSDSSVQNAIAVADALLTSDGATFGSPLLTSTSTTLQSSLLSY